MSDKTYAKTRREHAWMMVRAFRLLESRGVDLTVDDAKAVVDYVYEQALAEVVDIAATFKRSVSLHDMLLLIAIIKLGHAPEKDPTPLPPELAA
jgi:hypothetical protein